jgi:thiol-disulfide isomerase/thioredoxin
MSPKLPVISGANLIRALGKFGYVAVRQKGTCKPRRINVPIVRFGGSVSIAEVFGALISAFAGNANLPIGLVSYFSSGGAAFTLRVLTLPRLPMLLTSRRSFDWLGFARLLCSPIDDAMRLALRRSRFLRFVVTSLLLCFFPVLLSAQQENQPTIHFVRNPDPAPDFKLTGLDGKSVTLGDFHGKVVLLNFWATWCGPCRAEVPDLVELQNKYKDRLQVLGLVVDDEDDDAIKMFVTQFRINYPIAITSNEIRLQYGGIPALPTSFVLDAEGRIVQKHEGLRDPVLYETEVRSLLGLPIGDVRVETFEDTGQIFLKNAERASELPGVDLSRLTPEQKTVALHKFNAETCACGCKYTLAQCRIYDRNCQVSKTATAKIVAALAHPHPAASKSAPAKSSLAAPPSKENDKEK